MRLGLERHAIRAAFNESFYKEVTQFFISERKRQNKGKNWCDEKAGFADGYLEKVERGVRRFSFESAFCYGKCLGLEIWIVRADKVPHCLRCQRINKSENANNNDQKIVYSEHIDQSNVFHLWHINSNTMT